MTLRQEVYLHQAIPNSVEQRGLFFVAALLGMIWQVRAMTVVEEKQLVELGVMFEEVVNHRTVLIPPSFFITNLPVTSP